MTDSSKGQVTGSAAEVYEEFFVPALFAEWPPRVIEAAGIRPGQQVLDIACGTGVLARALVERVAPRGSVVGVDPNEGMLAVARRAQPAVEWRQGVAENLPFEPDSFDAVVSQFGWMFFDDHVAALREAVRVLRPGGCLAVAVWDSLDRTPGYAAVTALLQRLFGDRVADALRAPFNLGDPEKLRELCSAAGLTSAEISTLDGTAHFPSIQSWIHTDVKGWTLADLIDDQQYQRLQDEAPAELSRFVTDGGTVEFPAPAHLVVATVP